MTEFLEVSVHSLVQHTANKFTHHKCTSSSELPSNSSTSKVTHATYLNGNSKIGAHVLGQIGLLI